MGKLTIPANKLRIMSEDKWLDKYISKKGDGLTDSPQYLAMIGKPTHFIAWMKFRGLDWRARFEQFIRVYFNVVKNGQNEPVIVRNDFRIVDGHKRAIAMLIQKKDVDVVLSEEHRL